MSNVLIETHNWYHFGVTFLYVWPFLFQHWILCATCFWTDSFWKVDFSAAVPNGRFGQRADFPFFCWPSSHPSVRSKSITELEALHSKTFGFWIFQFPPDFQILWGLCPMSVTLTESWICPLASIVSCLYDVSVVIFWLWHYCRWCWTNGCHSDAFSC